MLSMMIISCSTSDDMAEQFNETTQPEAKQVDLLVSIGNGLKTRQMFTRNSAATAACPGMYLMVAIPYHTNGAAVTTSDDPLINLVGADEDNLAKE
jgi:hypothetical protein